MIRGKSILIVALPQTLDRFDDLEAFEFNNHFMILFNHVLPLLFAAFPVRHLKLGHGRFGEILPGLQPSSTAGGSLGCRIAGGGIRD